MSSFNVLLDSGFWIALLDPNDEHEKIEEAERIAKEIEGERLIVPFPTLYEFVSSRLSRREAVYEFEKLISLPNIERLPDTKYKEIALENFFFNNRRLYNDISLVDEVIKLIIRDKDIKIDYIATFDTALRNEALSLGIKLPI